MESANVPLVRRDSGGGAVYHDVGNGIWSFLSRRKALAIDKNMQIVVGALNRYVIY